MEPYLDEIEEEWRDSGEAARRAKYYYVRATQVNGGVAWPSPLWVNRSGQP